MNLSPVFGVGGLRIAQSTINKQTSRYMNSMPTYYQFGLYFESFAAIFSLIYFLIIRGGEYNVQTLIISIITGACFFFELITALKALQIAPLPLCTLCAFGGGIVLPAICGIFFFNEPLSLFQWGGAVLFFIAVYFLMFEKNQNTKVSISAILVLAVNFLLNGALSLLSKYFAIFIENGSPALYSCLSYTFASILFVFAVIFSYKSVETKTKQKFINPFNTFEKPLYLYGVLLGAVCATIVFLNAFLSRTIPIIILNVIPTTISIVGSLFIGLWFFKEKITFRKVIGIMLSVASTLAIIML